VVSTEGTILAFCEGRKHSIFDDSDIEIVLKRSLDNGLTWQDMQIVWDEVDHTIGNPCPVVDQDTGTIWLPFSRDNDRVFVTKSTDDGITWSTPEEITDNVKLPAWEAYGTGPGHGIQLSTGRLLIPCWHSQGKFSELEANDDREHSHVFYSDDHGCNWELGGIVSVQKATSECQVLETSDGSVFINMRQEPYDPESACRACAWSDDGGNTWSEIELDEGLSVSVATMAGIVRFTNSDCHDKNRVLFSSPTSRDEEQAAGMTVRLSYDECHTWTSGKVIYEGRVKYSDLCIAPDMTICCMHERGKESFRQGIAFARFSLEWLTDGTDKIADQ